MGSERKVSPWLAGAVCLVVGLGLGGGAMLLARRQAGLSEEVLESLTVEAERSPLTLKIGVNGKVEPERSTDIGPTISGRLASVLVAEGDIVAAGDPVAEMDSRDLNARYLQAKASQLQAEARLKELQAGETPVIIDQVREEVRQAQAQMVVEAAAVAESQAAVQEAAANIDEAQSQLDLANIQLVRNQALEKQGAISTDRLDELTTAANRAVANVERTKASLDRSRTALARAQASQAQAQSRLDAVKLRLVDTEDGPRPEQLEQAEAQVIEAVGQVQAIEIQKQDSILRAPFAGIITQRNADPGSIVTISLANTTSVVTLAQGVQIQANVPEVDISAIRLEQIVEISADAFPGQTFIGQVSSIAPEAKDENNVTSFSVTVTLSSGQQFLRSGMNVDLTFIGESIDNALVVPTVAIVTRKGERGVLVPDERNVPEFQPVRTGVSIGDQTQILSGIEPGERVFIDLPSDRRFQEEEE